MTMCFLLIQSVFMEEKWLYPSVHFQRGLLLVKRGGNGGDGQRDRGDESWGWLVRDGLCLDGCWWEVWRQVPFLILHLICGKKTSTLREICWGHQEEVKQVTTDLSPQKKPLTKNYWGTSLAPQWIRIHLLMQGTWVWSLVQEDPTCLGATRPLSHNYWACALEPENLCCWAHVRQSLKPVCLEPALHKGRHCNEKLSHRNQGAASVLRN